MSVHASIVNEIGNVLGNSFVNTFVDESKAIYPFSAVLVAFWHATLSCAVKCEQFAIDEANRYKQEHGLTSTLPWQCGKFSQHIQQLYSRRHRVEASDMESFFSRFRSQMGVEFLFPFLLTMRFEESFDALGLCYDTNYSLQIILRFEEALLPNKMRRFGAALLDRSLDDEKIFRFIWHKIMFGHTMLLNNSFAFFLYSIISKEKCVQWNADWRVTSLFSIAGSYFNAKMLQNLCGHERVVLPTDASAGPDSPQESTWLALLLTANDQQAVHGRRRVIYCSVSTNDIEQEIFLKPWLPFFCLSLTPTLAPSVVEMLQSHELMRAEMQAYFVADDVVDLLGICQASQTATAQVRYQIDAVREVQPIAHRLVELFDCMSQATLCIVGLRRQLVHKLEEAKKAKGKNSIAIRTAALEYEKETTANCSMLEHLRDNSVATFVLLFYLQKFYTAAKE